MTLRFFDGCPHWQTADARLREALDLTGHADVAVAHETVETPEDADRLGFIGSPTVLIDGSDPFAAGFAGRPRVPPLRDARGPGWIPTVDQLTEVVR